MKERIHYKTRWIVRKYRNKEVRVPYEVVSFDGNLLLNEGITELLTLLIGGAGTAFDNSNAYLGVGDSNAGANPIQTGLQAASNKLYKAMNATYPQVSGQTVTFQSEFADSEANFALVA